MNNLLIDTNVLIYAFDITSEFHRKSVEILESTQTNLFITTKNVSEFFSVCSKLDLDRDKTFGFFSDIKENVTILKPTDKSLAVFEELVKKYKPRGNKVYDIEIVSIMLSNEIVKVVTANIDDFKNIEEIEVIKIN